MPDSDTIYRTRLNQLRSGLRRAGLDGMVVLDRHNTRYLTGFTGTASIVLVGRDETWFLTDFRYIEIARKTLAGFTVLRQKVQGGYGELAKLAQKCGMKKIGFERTIAFFQYAQLQEALQGVELEEAAGLITDLRACKAPDEIRRLRRVIGITDDVFVRILPELRPGLTELQVRRRLGELAAELGALEVSFPAIVASGPNSALPHYAAGTRALRRGDLLTLDMGFLLDGYCSDMTRTVVLGRATAKQKKIYRIVLEAQRRAARAIRPGRTGKQVDAVARNHITRQGYGKYFGHGTGHGVGLEIHEAPRLNKESKQVLKPGMVVSCEPGVYLPGWGGVRIEDLVLVTRAGGEILSRAPKELFEIEC